MWFHFSTIFVPLRYIVLGDVATPGYAAPKMAMVFKDDADLFRPPTGFDLVSSCTIMLSKKQGIPSEPNAQLYVFN